MSDSINIIQHLHLEGEIASLCNDPGELIDQLGLFSVPEFFDFLFSHNAHLNLTFSCSYLYILILPCTSGSSFLPEPEQSGRQLFTTQFASSCIIIDFIQS